ncbi:hypothetical protein [Neobacillus niacini]|nr:hypothetical protein [Neobacillus niacini]MDR7001967.1 hypothetical protein [Neobacillus niacini]
MIGDSVLIEKVLEGNDHAFRLLVEKYHLSRGMENTKLILLILMKSA